MAFPSQFDAEEEEFIECTFHQCEPIKSKPEPDDPVIKPFVVPIYNDKPNLLSDRFQKINEYLIENNIDNEDEEMKELEKEENYQELEAEADAVEVTTQERKVKLMLAQKLKRRAIANKLGQRYLPRCGDLRLSIMGNRNSLKNWTARFGAMLEAKKLLYLPLLYRKYRSSGPRKSKEELDLEIDLYMSEVKNRFKKVTAEDIDQMEQNGHVTDVSDKLKKIFGGSSWNNTKKLSAEEEIVFRTKLDEELDKYNAIRKKMKANEGKGDGCETTTKSRGSFDLDDLDADIEEYWSMRPKKQEGLKQEPIQNHVNKSVEEELEMEEDDDILWS